MSNLNQLSNSVMALINARDKAIQEISNIVNAAKRIEDALCSDGSEACPVYDLVPLKECEPLRAQIDAEMWRKVFSEYSLYPAMDNSEVKQLNTWLYGGKPPHFTAANVASVLGYFSIESDSSVFDQALVKVFARLMRGDYTLPEHKFSVRGRFKLSALVRDQGVKRVSMDVRELINNMDKAVKQLSGKAYTENELVECINQALSSNSSFEDGCYSVSAGRNGNLIIELKDGELVQQLNQVVSNWYQGNSIIEFSDVISHVSHSINTGEGIVA